MLTVSRSFMIVAITVVGCTLTSQSAFAGEMNAAQKAARDNALRSGSAITKLAYVTSNSHTSTTYQKGVDYGDTFELTFRYDYKDSDGDPQYFVLTYKFLKNGTYTGFSKGPHSSFWPPFNVIEISGAVIEEALKK
ncbi:MAG: hypothetical protein R3B84_19750 [Zavarzinella sp.]